MPTKICIRALQLHVHVQCKLVKWFFANIHYDWLCVRIAKLLLFCCKKKIAIIHFKLSWMFCFYMYTDNVFSFTIFCNIFLLKIAMHNILYNFYMQFVGYINSILVSDYFFHSWYVYVREWYSMIFFHHIKICHLCIFMYIPFYGIPCRYMVRSANLIVTDY